MQEWRIYNWIPLSESTCTQLPDELKNSLKGIINIKNDDNACFVLVSCETVKPIKNTSRKNNKSG